jgi:hypothetical protein
MPYTNGSVSTSAPGTKELVATVPALWPGLKSRVWLLPGTVGKVGVPRQVCSLIQGQCLDGGVPH